MAPVTLPSGLRRVSSVRRPPSTVAPLPPTFRHVLPARERAIDEATGGSEELSRIIAIIGHGRSPEGRGWGPCIDRADIVIRMWDCQWQDPADHGERYDFGLIEASPRYALEFTLHNRRQPAAGWIASMLHRWWNCTLPERTEYVDQAPWNELGRAIGGIGATGRLQYTRGTIAACYAITRAAAGDEVVLVGFDDIWRRQASASLEEAFSDAYRANPGTFPFAGYRCGVTKMGNHDYAIERPVMERLAADHGVALRFAQEVWATPTPTVIPAQAGTQEPPALGAGSPPSAAPGSPLARG